MKFLSSADILGADDLEREPVAVVEWGGSVMVRGLTATERDQWERSFLKARGNQPEFDLEKAFANMRARLCAMCMVDETGKRLFEDKQVSDLGAKSAQALDRVFAVAQRLSGITKADVDELTEVLKENPFGVSDSASASLSESPTHGISTHS
jgi:hypothetical protein